jgi:hypothetical protein
LENGQVSKADDPCKYAELSTYLSMPWYHGWGKQAQHNRMTVTVGYQLLLLVGC